MLFLPFETEITQQPIKQHKIIILKKKKSISPIGIKKGDLCSVNIHVSIYLLKITNGNRSQMYLVFILYILSTFLLDLRYRTWKDGEKNLLNTITGMINHNVNEVLLI